ncbi:putative non-specific serine/threonine protein kinase [Helianthus anomalus]
MKLITLKFFKFKSHFFHYCNWVNTRSEEHSVKAISAKLSTLKTSKPDTRLPTRSSKKPGSRTLISHIMFFNLIKREIATLKILKHPNVVRLHEIFL